MAQEIFFSDLDLDFVFHPINRDVARKFNETAIARSIRHLILTNKYERPFNPEVGGDVRSLLFEPADIVTADALQNRITYLIESQESRVKDVSVEVSLLPDESAFECTIYFTAINKRTPTSITLFLKRVR